MVYRRRKSFRRRRFRRRSGRRGYKRIKKVVRRTVYNMAETKSATYSLPGNFTSIGTSWSELILIPAQGAQSTMIVGRRYEIIGFSLFGSVSGGQSNTSADDKYNSLRIVAAVFDGSASGLAPSAKWPSMPQGTATPIRVRTPTWPADGSTQLIRRKLKDKYITLNSVGRDSTGYMPAIRAVGFRYRFKKPLIVNYSIDGGGGYKPDKYIGIGMMSDSTAIPAPGFLTGALTWFWKDL